MEGLKHNLLSISQLCDNGCEVVFKPKVCEIKKAKTAVALKSDRERIEFEMMDLKKFIEDNSTIGLRNMINLLQISCKDNAIDFSTMKSVKSEQEEQIVTLVLNIFKKLQETNNVNERILALNNPLNSSIAPLYSAILEHINYNYDINYSTIFLELYDRTTFLPILVMIDKYLHSMDSKRFQHIHFISFIYESIKCWLEMGI